MQISMAEFAPIFGWLSFFGGGVFGFLIGSFFSFYFASLWQRQMPTARFFYDAAKQLCWTVAPMAMSFIFFRYAFGLHPFDPATSLRNIVSELLLNRFQFFASGAFVCLFLPLAHFAIAVAGLKHSEQFGTETDVEWQWGSSLRQK